MLFSQVALNFFVMLATLIFSIKHWTVEPWLEVIIWHILNMDWNGLEVARQCKET